MMRLSKLNHRFPVGAAHGYGAVVNCRRINSILQDGRFCKSKANLIEESVMKRITSSLMLVAILLVTAACNFPINDKASGQEATQEGVSVNISVPKSSQGMSRSVAQNSQEEKSIDNIINSVKAYGIKIEKAGNRIYTGLHDISQFPLSIPNLSTGYTRFIFSAFDQNQSLVAIGECERELVSGNNPIQVSLTIVDGEPAIEINTATVEIEIEIGFAPPSEKPTEGIGFPIESPVSLSKVYVSGKGTDPVVAEGLYDLNNVQSPFDISKMVRDGIIVERPESSIEVRYSTGDNAYTSIRNSNEKSSGGASIPFEAVIGNASFTSAQNKSHYSVSNSRYGQVLVRIVTRRQRYTKRSPGDLEPYFSDIFRSDVEKKSGPQLLSIYDPIISLAEDTGMIIPITMSSNKNSTGTISSYDINVGLGVSIINDALMGVNASYSTGTSNEVRNVSENSSLYYKILGGNYRGVWATFEEAVLGIPDAISTLTDSNTAEIGLPSWRETVTLWSLVAEINPQKANEVFEAYVRKVAAKALELDALFGGWSETVRFNSPGDNMVNLTLNPHDLIMLYLGNSSGGDQGDYKYKYTTGFLGTQVVEGWNTGAPGQPGSGSYIFLQADPKSIGAETRKEILLKLSITIGRAGNTGTNTAGTNGNGQGGKGTGSKDSVVVIERPDGSKMTLTVLGSAGGGYSWQNTAATLSPLDFPGLYEFKSSLGVGTQGAIVNGLKIGADSSCKPGAAVYQILRLN
jgi:hypothetical protein